MLRAAVYAALAALAVPAVAARLGDDEEPDVVVLKGVTTQGGYTHLTLADGRPTYFAAGLSAQCEKSHQWWNTRWSAAAGSRFPLRADGDRLYARESRRRAYLRQTGDFDVGLRGSFGPEEAKGTIDFRVALRARGRRLDACRVSALRWEAKAKP